MISNKIIETLQNIHETDYSIIGKSLATLSKFTQEKLPVSNGFVITTVGFNYFLDFSNLKKYYANSLRSGGDFKDIKQAIDAIEFPNEFITEVSKGYAKISGFTDSFVNLRALILDHKGSEVNKKSFVILDIRSEKNLLINIKQLYKNVIFDNEELIPDFFEGKLQIVILVQKAQQSEASGLMFTTDVITNDPNKLSIEAVYGLESIVDLERVVPDQYIFNKKQNKISEKHITDQQFMAVRQLGGSNNIEKVKISPSWQKRQKLDDKHIFTLAKTGQIIEDGLGEPQEIIWSFEAGKIWINFIESSNKLHIKKNSHPDLKELVHENFVHSNIDENHEQSNKNSLIDLVFSNEQKTEEKLPDPTPVELPIKNETPIINKIEQNFNNKDSDMLNLKNSKQNNSEPLLEGKYFMGGEVEADVVFDPTIARSHEILVLKGDEDLPANIDVKGFIIEDESELLTKRLYEYFKVPVITGVPLARKILKQGERIKMEGQTGKVYETVPFSDQVGEIEMNFKTTKPEFVEPQFTTPVQTPPSPTPTYTPPTLNVSPQTTNHEPPTLPTEHQHTGGWISHHRAEAAKAVEPQPVLPPQVEETAPATQQPVIQIEGNENVEINVNSPVVENNPGEALNPFLQTNKADISKILNLVEEDVDIAAVKEEDAVKHEVSGMSENDQFSAWGRSLENIISASKSVEPIQATAALEQVIEDTTQIADNSKEMSFDTDEQFIGETLRMEEENKNFASAYIPTATKVYLHLVDERLPAEFKNYDGIIFSSSFDMDLYLEIIQDTLTKCDGKDLLVICPPYETAALSRFIEQIYAIRNQGYRNLSIILPDYRNKKEIVEIKKVLSSIGLRRSSTFNIYANVSRTINVFRVEELDEGLVDGMHVDLFRLKMNMLGAEKLTASTRYAEGLKNMVEYINHNMKFDSKTILNISGFSSPKNVISHLSKFKFGAIAAGLGEVNNVKKEILAIENNHIINATNHTNIRKRR